MVLDTHTKDICSFASDLDMAKHGRKRRPGASSRRNSLRISAIQGYGKLTAWIQYCLFTTMWRKDADTKRRSWLLSWSPPEQKLLYQGSYCPGPSCTGTSQSQEPPMIHQLSGLVSVWFPGSQSAHLKEKELDQVLYNITIYEYNKLEIWIIEHKAY